MTMDYIEIGISIVIFILYLAIILVSLAIKRRLNKEVGGSFLYIIIAILFLTARRLQQIFFKIDLMESIPYFTDILTFIFAFLFFIAIFIFYRAIKKAGGSRRRIGGNLQEYKRNLGRKIIR